MNKKTNKLFKRFINELLYEQQLQQSTNTNSSNQSVFNNTIKQSPSKQVVSNTNQNIKPTQQPPNINQGPTNRPVQIAYFPSITNTNLKSIIGKQLDINNINQLKSMANELRKNNLDVSNALSVLDKLSKGGIADNNDVNILMNLNNLHKEQRRQDFESRF